MNIKSYKTYILIAAIASFLGTSDVFAAAGNVNGGLKGQVTNNREPLAQVQITIENTSTGQSRTLQTDQSGNFRVGGLPVGVYVVKLHKQGYQDSLVRDVAIHIGSDTALNIPLTAGVIEEITVEGKQIVIIDTGSAESALNISTEAIGRIPVPRSVTSVALLAPGATEGDRSFESNSANEGLSSASMASIGGSSVGENTFYINGLNVTNFRNGLGGSTVPFEFYREFQIKSGGYSAEFGRSTGGVINAVTKHGTNEFEYGVVTHYEPELWRGTGPNTRNRDGSFYDFNEENTATSTTIDIYAGGPIIEDRLFFYVLYEPRDIESEFASLGSPNKFNEKKSDDAFWGGSLDWNITDNHQLSVTAFSDKRSVITKQFNYDTATEQKTAFIGTVTDERGGDNMSVMYSGRLTDKLSLSAMWGKNEYDLTSFSSNDLTCPFVVDARASAPTRRPGCEVNSSVERGADEREAMRLDAELYLDRHTLRFGVDREVNTSFARTQYSGGNAYYRYLDVIPGATLPNGGTVPVGVNQVVRYREFSNGGSFETISQAFYIEDKWQVTQNIVASIGVRNESFENKNSFGKAFIDIDDQWAPRLGLIWDLSGTGESKLYANWGRYHLPIANNTNVRLAGAERDFQRFFVWDGQVDPVTAAPTQLNGKIPASEEIGSILLVSNGVVPDARAVLDSTIDPMYQDELILGYEKLVGEDWKIGVRYVNRDLSSTIEDVIISHATDARGYASSAGRTYILTNPGSSVKTFFDTDGDGTLEPITLSAGELGYPDAERTYEAVDFTFERLWDGKWNLKGSYTWARSTGNAEGYVKSDNGQDDAGILQDFDFPELMDGANGYLPNDRRHMLKLFGTYQATDSLQLGLNMLVQSGRPVNAFGAGHPAFGFPGEAPYGDTYYLWNASQGRYNKISRGKMGRTDWVTRFDFSAIFTTNIGFADLEVRADLFNIFDASATTEVYEFAEVSAGAPDSKYGLSQYYQRPRNLRLGVALRF